jgi:PncC family amidohydrolase
MERLLDQIHDSLLKTGKTVGVAESCTGGLLSELLTQNPGSSGYFNLGVITYSNKAKETVLGIPTRIIKKNGAVSKETAQKMAHSVRTLAKTDFGMGITGIAGPSGGTPEKPPGTVFIAIDAKNKKICEKFVFQGSRAAIRKKAAEKALELLSKFL